jgi:hypothetical protein
MLSATRRSDTRTLKPAGAHFATRAAIAIAAAFICALMLARADTSAPAAASTDFGAQPTSSVALAQALTAALNTHDVEALVQLFSEEGPGATVHADRYAWTKYEIRLWAQQQVRANIQIDAHDYWVTDHGAAWNATVYRQDWRELGVNALPVLNAISVADGKLMDFTARRRTHSTPSGCSTCGGRGRYPITRPGELDSPALAAERRWTA